MEKRLRFKISFHNCSFSCRLCRRENAMSQCSFRRWSSRSICLSSSLMMHSSMGPPQQKLSLCRFRRKGISATPEIGGGKLQQNFLTFFSCFACVTQLIRICTVRMVFDQREALQCTPWGKLLIDEARLRKMPFHCCIIDFKKAFDSVSWASVRSALHFWHVPESLESAIFSIIEGHELCVRCGSDVSEPIHIKKGVLQRDTLAPFLFVLVVDKLLRRLPQVGIDVSLHACRRGTTSRPQQDNRTILNTFAYADEHRLRRQSLPLTGAAEV